MICASVDSLLAVLDRGASEHDGEAIDLLAHGLQCAALLADEAPEDRELQIAGLVHDLGTVLEPGAPTTHATTGAAAIAPLLGSRVAALVAGHDQAKRYLVTSDPEYRSVLSELSVITLGFQGGDMSDAELREFESDTNFDALVMLRRADDAAKVPGRVVPGLDTWRPALDQLAAASKR